MNYADYPPLNVLQEIFAEKLNSANKRQIFTVVLSYGKPVKCLFHLCHDGEMKVVNCKENSEVLNEYRNMLELEKRDNEKYSQLQFINRTTGGESFMAFKQLWAANKIFLSDY